MQEYNLPQSAENEAFLAGGKKPKMSTEKPNYHDLHCGEQTLSLNNSL